MPFDFGTIISRAIPSLIGAGATYIGDRAARSANQDAVNFSREGAGRAADIYETAYDDIFGYQQAAIEQDEDLDGQRLRTFLQGQEGVTNDYAANARGTLGQYQNLLTNSDNEWYNQMLAADAVHQGYTTNAALTADQALGEGVNFTQQQYAPWADAGPQAVQGLQAIASTPASELDPSQRIAGKQLDDDLSAQRAASGQRGSGHWGAVQGEAKAMQGAQFYDRNRTRQIAALDMLSKMGMDARGQVANAGTAASNQSAGNWRSAINDMGDTNLQVQEAGANRRDATNNRIGDQMVNTEDAISQQRLESGNRGVNEISDWYDSQSRRGYAEAGARGQQIGGTADARAGAEAGPAYLQAQAALANGRLTGDTTGAMSAFLADMFRDESRRSSTPAYSDNDE